MNEGTLKNVDLEEKVLMEEKGVEIGSGIGFSDVKEDKIYIKPVKPFVSGLRMSKMPEIITRKNKQDEDFDVFQMYFVDPQTKAVFEPTLYIPASAEETPKDKEEYQKRLQKRYLSILGTLTAKSKLKSLKGNTWKELINHALTLLDEKEVLNMTFDIKMGYPKAGGTFAGFPAIGIVVSSNKYPTVITAWNGEYDKEEIVGGRAEEEKIETSVNDL